MIPKLIEIQEKQKFFKNVDSALRTETVST